MTQATSRQTNTARNSRRLGYDGRGGGGMGGGGGKMEGYLRVNGRPVERVDCNLEE